MRVGDELDRLAFVKPERSEAPAQDHVGIVSGIDRAGGHKGAKHPRGDIGEAMHARDFLDEVDVTLEVGAE